MPKKSSKAGHVPERTCVICKKKKEQYKLIRFAILDSEIVFDLKRKITARGYYVCDDNDCMEKLDKWLQKHIKKNG
ncbi:MAG: DUF448 domain-containing protein [Candidatus Cloacimonetes bacterium]|nr:DUF448 domain-containing protein [Candidatus Cloacimonadota bacterium]